MRAGVRAALGCAVALILAACGGGGGGGSSTGGGTIGTTGTTGSLMTDAARQIIINNALTAIKKLPLTDGQADPNALLAAAKTVKGLTNLQLGGDGSVYGQFSDGVAATFFNDALYTAPSSKSKTSRITVSNSISTSTVQLLDSADEIFIGDRTTDDAGMFNAHGYSGTTVALGTVENYRAIGGKAMSCLNMSGHGGPAKNAYTGSELGYGIWTATDAGTTSTGTTYHDDLADGSIGIGFGTSFYSTLTDDGYRSHYMLLPKFFSKYGWKFATNSYVTLGVCWGASTFAASMRTALFDLGASVVAGWTRPTYPDWDYFNNSYMFDRTLGANVVNTTSPGHRPFAWPSVYAALNRMNDITRYGRNSVPSVWTFFTAPGSDQNHGFQLLNPSLIGAGLQATTDGKSTNLILAGSNFGVPGGNTPTVSIGGKTYTPTLDKYGSYEVPLAYSACYGPLTATVLGPAGEKLVSNPRNFSVWSGSISTTTNSYGNVPGAATVEAKMPIQFRKDLQSTYTNPDDATPTAPVPTTANGHALYSENNDTDDTMSVTASGTYTSKYYDGQGNLLSTQTDTYAGSQSQPLFGGFNGASLSIPPNPSSPAYMQVFEDTKQTMTDTQVLTIPGQGSTTTTGNLNASFTSEVFTNVSGDQWVQIGIDSNYNVTANTLTVSSDGQPRYILDYSLTCTYPPVSTTPR